MPQETRDVKPCPKCGTPIRKRAKLCGRCFGRNTPEQRDQHALCGALRKNGERCRNYAGFRTSHKGYGRCWLHTGNAPSQEKAAAVAEAREQMGALGEPLPEDTRPTQLLLWLTRVVGGHVQTLLGDPADFNTEVGRAKFRLTMEQIDRAARLAKQCSEAGAEQAEIAVKQSQAALMATMVKAALTRVGFSDLDIQAAGVALRLLAKEAEGDTAGAERCQAELDALTEKLIVAEEQRIEREVQRRLPTIPPEEIGRGEDMAWLDRSEPETEEVTPEPANVSAPPRLRSEPAPAPGQTNYRSDARRGGDPLFGKF